MRRAGGALPAAGVLPPARAPAAARPVQATHSTPSALGDMPLGTACGFTWLGCRAPAPAPLREARSRGGVCGPPCACAACPLQQLLLLFSALSASHHAPTRVLLRQGHSYCASYTGTTATAGGCCARMCHVPRRAPTGGWAVHSPCKFVMGRRPIELEHGTCSSRHCRSPRPSCCSLPPAAHRLESTSAAPRRTQHVLRERLVLELRARVHDVCCVKVLWLMSRAGCC